MARAAPAAPASVSVADRIALGALTSTFPPELVDRVVADSGRREQRRRLLPARVVVYYVLALALFAGAAYEEVMRCLVEGLGGRGRRGGADGPGRTGMSQAPRRWRMPAPGWARRGCGCCARRRSGRWPSR
jgi:Insertion element 4 transposase N-terminal